MTEQQTEAVDCEVEQLTATLKAYYKLCLDKDNRDFIIKDSSFLSMLTSLLSDTRTPVMTYIVKILLTLTERKEDSLSLSNVTGLESAIGVATENVFPPAVLSNLLVIASRIRAAKSHKVTAFGDHAGTSCVESKKFVSRKSKQMVFEFEEIDDELRSEIERRCLAKKGVISVYFDMNKKRAVLRTTQVIQAKDISEIFFDCGCDIVTQLVKIDGVEEHFRMYATEREKKVSVPLPDYIDDIEHILDPHSTIVTNEYAQKGGWFSSVASIVKFW